MSLPDRERWKQMEPLLEELLGMPPDARAARLFDVRMRDPLLAWELEAMLRAAAAAESARFLEGRAAGEDFVAARKPRDS
jgi:hypothetical protein